MLMFKNETVTHRYFPEVKAATSVWYGFRNQKSYNEALYAILHLIEDRHVNFWVAVMHEEGKYPANASSNWTKESWLLDAASKGLRKIAIVCPSGWVYSDTVIEGLTVHYCTSFDEARSWVIGQA